MPPSPASRRKIPSKYYRWLFGKKMVAAVRHLKAPTYKHLCFSLGIEGEEQFIFCNFLLRIRMVALRLRTALEFSAGP